MHYKMEYKQKVKKGICVGVRFHTSLQSQQPVMRSEVDWWSLVPMTLLFLVEVWDIK